MNLRESAIWKQCPEAELILKARATFERTARLAWIAALVSILWIVFAQNAPTVIVATITGISMIKIASWATKRERWYDVELMSIDLALKQVADLLSLNINNLVKMTPSQIAEEGIKVLTYEIRIDAQLQAEMIKTTKQSRRVELYQKMNESHQRIDDIQQKLWVFRLIDDSTTGRITDEVWAELIGETLV